MYRWIKKGVLRLADREISQDEVLPDDVLSAERLAEFLVRGWVKLESGAPLVAVDEVNVNLHVAELPSVHIRAKQSDQVKHERKAKQKSKKRRSRSGKRAKGE